MTRPPVTPTTERIYAELPEVLRNSDAGEASGGGYPLLRYISLIGDQLDEISTLLDRFFYDDRVAGDTSDLVDPATADAAWLAWLSQLLGVRLTGDETGRRSLLANAGGGWHAGTAAAIASAAQAALTGNRSVAVYPFYAGDPWVIEVRTRPGETPSAQAVIDAILAANVKPAGAALVVTIADATWTEVQAAWPLWSQVDALDWQRYERGS